MIIAILIKPNTIFQISFLALSSGLISSLVLIFFLIKNSYIFSFKSDKDNKDPQTQLPISIPLLIQPILVSSSFLIIQNLIGSSYGTKELSFFVLCTTLIGVIMSLMMASGRMYFLPKLGSLTVPGDRNKFFQTNIYFFLSVALVATIIIFFFSPFIIKILYSEEFLESALMLSLFHLQLF